MPNMPKKIVLVGFRCNSLVGYKYRFSFFYWLLGDWKSWGHLFEYVQSERDPSKSQYIHKDAEIEIFKIL